MRTKRFHGSVRRFVLSGTVLAATAGAVVVAVPGTASAAGCTVKTGTTANLRQTASGIQPVGGARFTKGSICLDLNITHVSATDSYEGWLRRANGTWFACSKGFVHINAGDAAVVLCSSVAAGTVMAVVQASNTQRTITAEY